MTILPHLRPIRRLRVWLDPPTALSEWAKCSLGGTIRTRCGGLEQDDASSVPVGSPNLVKQTLLFLFDGRKGQLLGSGVYGVWWSKGLEGSEVWDAPLCVAHLG